MVIGIGRGDSARRYIGQQPVPVGRFEEALRMIKPFMNGERVQWNGKDFELGWARGELPEIEMHVAAYGPSVAVAGRVGDGVHPARRPGHHPVDDATARAAAEAAGRDPAALNCIVSAPSHISDDIAQAPNSALVPRDGVQPRARPDPALWRGRLGDPEGLDDGAGRDGLRLRRTRASAPTAFDRRDLRPFCVSARRSRRSRT